MVEKDPPPSPAVSSISSQSKVPVSGGGANDDDSSNRGGSGGGGRSGPAAASATAAENDDDSSDDTFGSFHFVNIEFGGVGKGKGHHYLRPMRVKKGKGGSTYHPDDRASFKLRMNAFFLPLVIESKVDVLLVLGHPENFGTTQMIADPKKGSKDLRLVIIPNDVIVDRCASFMLGGVTVAVYKAKLARSCYMPIPS